MRIPISYITAIETIKGEENKTTLPKEQAEELYRKIRSAGGVATMKKLQHMVDGKCQCSLEIIKIFNAEKSFRSDKTRYVYKDPNHKYNQESIGYDIFRCEKCSSVIGDVWCEDGH